ncbi:MAG: RnfABCDGE type electron transport complex subunit D [Phycisphaerales bacterium]|nr:MAG: RnfABCDGE type electron transport complex subunit D [Phycisphaerales bacterium]
MSASGELMAAVRWPRSCEVRDPPYIHSGASSEQTYWLFCVAAVPVMAAGAWVFGYGIVAVYVSAALGALLGERVCRYFVSHGSRSRFPHAMAMGLMLAMTLPPTVGLGIPLVGGFLGIVIGKVVLGGMGNYLWHPALVGWALVHLISPGALAPARWPFLAAGHGLTGSLEAVMVGAGYRGFGLTVPPPGVEAWSTPRPIDRLIGAYSAPVADGGADRSLLSVFRDHLPPWSDTVWGVAGGGIGETCAVAVLVGGLVLIFCRASRWQLPVAALGTVAVLAAVWPVRVDAGLAGGAPGAPGLGQAASPASALWFPILSVREGFPVGVAAVLFHLTGGGLLTACFLIAPDPVSTPLSGRGHLLFGVGLGALAFVGRVSGLTPGSVYWAILAMNTVVPVIDRITRRRVPGA